MDIVITLLAILFAFVFGFRFFWFVFAGIGSIMWQISGVFIAYAMIGFFLILFSKTTVGV